MKVHPNTLANLKIITSETARENQKKSTASRLLNIELQNQFKITAKAFLKVRDELPTITALDVIKMAMWDAIQNDQFDDAARYAEKVAEYEQPKLQRIDQTVTTRTEDLSDEELMRIISEEGLKRTSSEDSSDESSEDTIKV